MRVALLVAFLSASQDIVIDRVAGRNPCAEQQAGAGMIRPATAWRCWLRAPGVMIAAHAGGSRLTPRCRAESIGMLSSCSAGAAPAP